MEIYFDKLSLGCISLNEICLEVLAYIKNIKEQKGENIIKHAILGEVS